MPTCPHCGHEADASATECPLCGTRLDDGAAGEREGGGTTAPPAGAAARPGEGRRAGAEGAAVPWEDPDAGFLPGLLRTWRESLFEPAAFFGRLDDGGTIARPLLYFLLVTVIGAFFTLAWQSVWISVLEMGAYARAGEAMAAGPVISFFVSPFFALFGFLMATVVYHLGALVVAPERRGMGATARVVCYAAGPSLLAVVPLVGALVGMVWTLVLQVVGLREVHRTSTPRALLMVFWLPASFLLLALVAILFALAGGGVDDGGALATGAAPGLHTLAAAARGTPR